MMYRIEIISNQSVQDDIVELLEQEIPNVQYSILPDAQGRGSKSKKLGDTVWPEMNFILFVYAEEAEAKKIKAIIEAVRAKFPSEGISMFVTQGVEI